jgi:hypothetical protein
VPNKKPPFFVGRPVDRGNHAVIQGSPELMRLTIDRIRLTDFFLSDSMMKL